MPEPELDTQILPLLPLNSGVILPGMVVTLTIESPEARSAIEAARRHDDTLILVPRRDDGRYARVGTVAAIENEGRIAGGLQALVIRGIYRATIGTGAAGTGEATYVTFEQSDEPNADSPRARELVKEYRALVENIVEARGVPQVAEFLRGIDDPSQLADTAGYSPDLSFEQKLDILETLDVEQRLEKVVAWSKETLADVSLKDKIRQDVAEGMDKRQREFLLRQQMDAIKKELGEDTEENVVEEYRTKIAEANMPEGPRKEAERELGRLERTSEQSPEYGWIRTYLDWMVELPWDVRTEDNLDIAEAKRVLDEDHTGLEDVKERILEYLAVRKLRAERGLAASESGRGSGAILTLVGPPGVGKTSLGESVARALGRKFVRISLGGIHDEAEIRGHRRTYVGAIPGRIVRALKEAGTKNPVMMLDEVDKVGSDWRGDPSSALLEVLDPAQNHTFRDHYLEVDLDLSEVLFVTTANVSETIPGPLLDRMEVIRLDGYTEDEKVAIARDHLVRRQLARNGLEAEEVNLPDDSLRVIVGDYTREAGVRNLEREIGKVLRKVATKVASHEVEPPVTVEPDQIRDYLGRQKFFFEAAERTSVPGVATGLAVTGFGGDVLFVEATKEQDAEKDGLTLTGQLGDVMKESAQIALSYVRGHAGELAIDAAALKGRFHVHVPAGAVPKDGPSAGVTMTTALASLLTQRPVRSTVGMTGEVTLQGRVLPIGGLKQKVLAAHRAGLKEVILPKRNEGDLDDVPEQVKDEMTFHVAETIDQVLDWALEPEPAAPRQTEDTNDVPSEPAAAA
jgi:ATP-dependent Lon protease